jgi:hypothetical protein
MDMHLIWVRPERKYFCKRGWTGKLLNTTDLPVEAEQELGIFGI